MALTRKVDAAAMLDALLANFTGGSPSHLKIYTGSAPAAVATSATGTLLADCVLANNTGFAATNTTTLIATGNTSGGIFASTGSTAASGTMGYWRLTDSGGTAHLQGSVGVAGSGLELIMSSVTVVAGGAITISSFTVGITGIY